MVSRAGQRAPRRRAALVAFTGSGSGAAGGAQRRVPGAVSRARGGMRARPIRRRHCCSRCATRGRRCRRRRCAGCRPRRSVCSMPGSLRRRAGSSCAPAGCTTRRNSAEPRYFEIAAARSITRRMLVYGWHLARSRPRAACLVFGSTIAAIESLAACSLTALEAAADRNADGLRPRWANQTAFWRALLSASSAGADTRLHELLLGGIQRLAAETLAAHAP